MAHPSRTAFLDQTLAGLDEHDTEVHHALVAVRESAHDAGRLFTALGLDPIAVRAIIIANALMALEKRV